MLPVFKESKMNTSVENPFQAKNINLNTFIAIITLLGIFAGFVVTWTNIQNKQIANSEWQRLHDERHDKLATEGAARQASYNTRFDAIMDHLGKIDQDNQQLNYRVALNEKGIENADTRTSRISESYTSQITELRSVLSQLTTQIALANDSLARLETQDQRLRAPKELRN